MLALDILDDDRTQDSPRHEGPGSSGRQHHRRSRRLPAATAALRSRAVVDGDTLARDASRTKWKSCPPRPRWPREEFPGIIENVKLITAGLKTAEGTLGAFGMDSSRPEMRRILARSKRLMARISDSSGSLSLSLGAPPDWSERARRAMSQADSIRALLSSDRHSLGRFRRDSTIMRDIGRARDELAEVQRLAADPGGTVGRVRVDSAIVRAVRRGLVSMDSLRTDIRKHPLRYIAF